MRERVTNDRISCDACGALVLDRIDDLTSTSLPRVHAVVHSDGVSVAGSRRVDLCATCYDGLPSGLRAIIDDVVSREGPRE